MKIPLAVSRGSKVQSAWANDVVSMFGKRGVICSGAAQSTTSGAALAFVFNAEQFDPDGWITVPSSLLTVPSGQDGRYLVSATARWATTALGTQPMCDIVWNGSSWLSGSGLTVVGIHTVTGILNLVAGQTLQVRGYQNSGGAINCTPYLEIAPLSP